MVLTDNQQAFLALVQAGLWEQNIRLAPFEKIDFKEIYRLAEEQSVVGLVAAGLEYVVDMRIPKVDAIQFVGQALQMEQRNTAMNHFISVIVEKMRGEGIKSMLVKGQGIARCYERPLWRKCGDVDLLLDNENYERAKSFLTPLASSVDVEDTYRKHLAMTIEPWLVELHGTLKVDLGNAIDKGIERVLTETFTNNKNRTWQDGETDISLPTPDSDVVFVFTHILQHFFRGGIGLRQICDWCRLLWTYRESLDMNLLRERLESMRLMTVWNSFAAFVVKYLGMPLEAIPFYTDERKWTRKAQGILALVMESGNFGIGRDRYCKEKYPKLIGSIISFWNYTKTSMHKFTIIPTLALRGWWILMTTGIKATVRR